MQQLQTYRFYELGAKLHQLFCGHAHSRVADMFGPLTEAQALLDSFIKGDVLSLETSKADATRLLNKIGALFNRYFIDPTTKQLKAMSGEDRMDPNELSLIGALVEKFEHALAAELSRTPTYIAARRGIYSVYDLAEHAETMFSAELQKSIPQTTLTEFATAGRALAFGLGTAAVLHLLRAVEGMLRCYYEVFSGQALGRNERTYAIYLKKLVELSSDTKDGPRDKEPDPRVVQMLGQIKEHYRNPFISAENSASVDEAMQLFGLASALIGLMAEQVAVQTAAPTMPVETTEKSPADVMASAFSDDLGVDAEVYDYPLSQAG